MDELDLSAATAHERSLRALLTSARDDERTSLPARRLADQALLEWERGHRTRTLLFASPDDADGRLAAIRARLLEQLAALTPEAPPLAALLRRGDATPAGWTVALAEALRRTPGTVRATRRPQSLRARSEVRDWDDARRLLPLDDRAEARSLHAVSFCDGAGELLVAQVVTWERRPGWHYRHGPSIGLRTAAGHDWVPLPASAWRATAALVAGLYAAPALGFQPAAERYVVQLLRSALGRVAGRPRAAAWTLVELIEQLRELVPPTARAGRSQALVVPIGATPGAGLLLRTLDAIAGDGGGEPPLPTAAGCWVELLELDGSESAGEPVAGRLLEPPVAAQARSWAVRPDEPPRADADRLKAWVRVGDHDLRLPWTRLRAPRRARLFD